MAIDGGLSAVYVHGGVSGLDVEQPSLAFACEAARSAATALDAIESAVMALEDHPELNAGWGSVLTRAGRIELDAGVADGASGRFGGVINVTVRHPISLARRALESTPHVLLAGAGAMELADDMETLDGTTPEQLARYELARADGSLDLASYGGPGHVDTVGAVALDTEGRLAAGSSTGGVFGKLPGRVGDAPIFGAGTYASESAAVVGTGVGELFLETLACARAAGLIEDGAHPQLACERVIRFLGERSGLAAGLLALDARGRVGTSFRGGALAVAGLEGPLSPVALK